MNNNKRLYKISKSISRMYNVPLYIAWKYKYNPYDLAHDKKYLKIKESRLIK